MIQKIFVFCLLIQTASAAPYYRFWQGFQKSSLAEGEFVDGLNEYFIPETVEQGKGQGLLSYLPVLSYRNLDVPHEFALVTYESEKAYKEIRNTERGRAYGKAHWDFFEKDVSYSTVPRPYHGVVAIDHAYDIFQSDYSWQDGQGVFEIWKRDEETSTEDLLWSLQIHFSSMRKFKDKLGLKSMVVLISEDAIYQFSLYRQGFVNLVTLLSEYATLEQRTSLRRGIYKINEGEGLNTMFIP